MISKLPTGNTIRSRLVLMSAGIVLLLLGSLAATLLQTIRVISIYDTMADYQLLASRIYLRLSETGVILEDYLETEEPALLDKFNKTYPILLRDAIEYEEVGREPAGRRTVVDFRYMVQSYIEAANSAVTFSRDGNRTASNHAYFEARRIQKLIDGYLPKIFSVQAADVARIDENAKMFQRRSLLITGGVTLLIILISVFVTAQIAVSITRPVSKLVSVAGDVSVGKWDSRVEPIKARNEMLLLGSAFNEMLDKIQDQMQQLQRARERDQEIFNQTLDAHRAESLVKSAQLKTLQARINPHFLFNTLNIITQSAYLEESRKTAEITEAFASLMRFNLEHFDGEVTLSEEFTSLEDYIFLQRIRFGDRILISCRLHPQLSNERVPGLLLQPLVENAITHGMSDMTQDGRVEVSAEPLGDHYVLKVSDNGFGMTSDALASARLFATGDFPVDYGEHIGVRNVFERILLYTDSLAEISIVSERGKGTEIDIALPAGFGI